MRAVLPIVNRLPRHTWNIAYEPCFCDLQPPLTLFNMRISNDGVVPSLVVLEAIPALKSFRIQAVHFSQVYRAETF
jgi:hypothetical protein